MLLFIGLFFFNAYAIAYIFTRKYRKGIIFPDYIRFISFLLLFLHLFVFVGYIIRFPIGFMDVSLMVISIIPAIYALFILRRTLNPLPLILTLMMVILASTLYYFNGLGDSWVFLSKSRRISGSGVLCERQAFGNTVDDPRYRASFFPLLLAIVPDDTKDLFLYKIFPGFVLTLSGVFIFALLRRSLPKRISLLSTALFLTLLGLKSGGGIGDLMCINLPKIYTPILFFPMFFYYSLEHSSMVVITFFMIAFNHIFYAGLILIWYSVFFILNLILRFRLRWVIIFQLLVLIMFFITLQKIDITTPIVNPFFKKWQHTYYIEYFYKIFEKYMLSHRVFYKIGLFSTTIITPMLYIISIIFIIIRRNRPHSPLFLIPLTSIVTILFIGFNPLLTQVFIDRITAFKVVSVIQCMPFYIPIGLIIFYIYRLNRHTIPILLLLLIVLFFGYILSKRPPLPKLANLPRIWSYLRENQDRVLVSDEFTSFYTSSKTGIAVQITPAPFSSPYYDYNKWHRVWNDFVMDFNIGRLPEGCDLLLIPEIFTDRIYIKPIIVENGWALIRIK